MSTSPELRERKKQEDEASSETSTSDKKQDNYQFASRFKKFIILVGIWFVMVMAVSYGKSYLFGKSSSNNADDELFAKHFGSNYVELEASELAKYSGKDESKPILLAIQGRLYDVTRGKSYYGPNGGYHIFAGRDASRSFVTGCFDVNDEKCIKVICKNLFTHCIECT